MDDFEREALIRDLYDQALVLLAESTARVVETFDAQSGIVE